MQLTRFTDYALRVLMYLGGQADRLVTIREIAEKHGLSENHLMKIVHKLATRGYIETVRGKGGGMRLARRAEMISLGEVVRDTEENMDIAECFAADAQSCVLLPSCALRSVLIEARKSFLATLDLYALSDLIGRPGPSGNLGGEMTRGA
ncbi:MAG: Rrf2 family transcriptional regulator [Sulfuricella sp.]|jgi:Rrf2 family nitric oxide-sensitive transcriptional repressor|nr:Rrf2 family transcriptional regulator [Sulfuricella sp.]